MTSLGPRRHRPLPLRRRARRQADRRRRPAARRAARPARGAGRRGERRLTAYGKTLARLPLDPRLGRMLIEAERLGCTREVLVIVAALSIQDPRERPVDKEAQAQQQHARFKSETSDFAGFHALWRYLKEQQKALSSSAFRRMCKAEFLHYLRIREWQDLHQQLRSRVQQARIDPELSTAAQGRRARLGPRPPGAARRPPLARRRPGRAEAGVCRRARFAVRASTPGRACSASSRTSSWPPSSSRPPACGPGSTPPSTRCGPRSSARTSSSARVASRGGPSPPAPSSPPSG